MRILLTIFLCLFATAGNAAEPKRVLMVHSFGFDFSPWGEYAKYFRAELSQRMQEPVDLYDIPLSSARFDSQPDHQAFADYLNALFSGRRLDLVVTLGAPAARFFEQYRSRLFSSTPMLMTALDQRVVPADLTPNDTTVSNAIDFKSVVENILQVRPQTTTIAVVVGTSPIERYWKEQMRDAFETFQTRVTFEWFDKLSLTEMLDRAKTLPPRSSIFYFVFFVDGAGVSHGETAALTSLIAAANAPVFSYVDAYLGQGIVGGPLLSVQEISHRAAIVAARILGGQVAGDIKTRPIGFAAPKFDFREMQRWGIRDSQLPPGSEVLFRPPTAWEQYRWQIVLAGMVFAIQTLALIGLFYEHRRRRKAEVLARTSMFELSRSEKEFRDAFETIPAMAWTTRPDGANDFANRRWSEFSGMSSRDTSGVGWKAAFHSADIDTHVEKFYASLAAGTPFENEARVKRASDGEYRWFLHRAVPLRDEHGNILKWYGVSTEIDDRKRAEQALREREAKIRRLVDANIIGVFVGDVQGRILEANDAFLRIVGYDRQDLISGRMRVRDMTPPQWLDRTARTMAEVKLGKAVQPYEKEYVRKDGSRVPVLVGAAGFEEHGDQGVGFVVDLSERKRAEQALRESEEQWKAVFENNPTMYFMVESSGAILSVNPFGAEQLGFTVDELIGSPVQNLFHVEDREAVEKNTAICFERRGQIMSWEARKIRKSGEVLWVREMARVMLIKDRPVALIVCEDITERKRVSEALREVEMELAHANRVATMGQLTASIAHEVNQPIATARNNAASALRFLSRNPPDLEEVREALRCVVNDADRAGDIIDRMRAHFKKVPPRNACFDINDAINELIALARSEVVQKGVTVRMRLAEDLSPVQGDRVQLQQVVLNLILNAVEAMSSVDDALRELSISTVQSGAGEVLVAVRDSGPGLDPEHLERVFDSFYTTKPSGMGLGLSICRSIIEAHGGRLWAAANEPKGAVFQFTLPAGSAGS